MADPRNVQLFSRIVSLLQRRPLLLGTVCTRGLPGLPYDIDFSTEKGSNVVSTSDTCARPFSSAHAPWALPPDEWESRRARQAQRSRAAALQRIRNCCTLEELLAVLPQQGSSPALVVGAAQQLPRVVEWPLSDPDRRRVATALEALARQCAMSMEEYDMSNLAALLGVCARCRVVPGELIVPLQHRLGADAREGRIESSSSAGDLAALAGHLAQMRVGSRPLWGAVAAAVESCLGGQRESPGGGQRGAATAGDIARLLAAFARLEMYDKALWGRALAAALRTVPSAQPQDVALLMRCLAWARHSPDPEVPLLQHLDEHLAARRHEYDPVSLTDLAWAVAELGLRSRGLFGALAEVGAEALRRYAAVLRAPIVPGLTVSPQPPRHLGHHHHRHHHVHPQQQQPGASLPFVLPRPGPPPPVTPRMLLTLLAVVCPRLPRPSPPPSLPQRIHPPAGGSRALLTAAGEVLLALARRGAEAAQGGEGAAGEGAAGWEWECVEGCVQLMGEAGLQGEAKELVRQLSALRPGAEERQRAAPAAGHAAAPPSSPAAAMEGGS